jgi:hypothetical protein
MMMRIRSLKGGVVLSEKGSMAHVLALMKLASPLYVSVFLFYILVKFRLIYPTTMYYSCVYLSCVIALSCGRALD